jgi:peptide/nickel transport system substrate-binding protein
VSRLRAVLVLLLLAACSNEQRLSPSAADSAVDESKPQEGGTVVRRLETDLTSLNPLLAQTRYDHYVVDLLFTPVVELDADLLPVPGLAEKWEITPDGKQYTFHLNPKATFSDGTPVRASDVLFTLKKIADPSTKAGAIAGDFEQLDLSNTRAVDDHTIVVGFKEALAPQLVYFNDVRVLPEHVYRKGDFNQSYSAAALGSGPYKLVRRDGAEVILERRADYWRTPKPYVQTLRFKVLKDDATAWNAMKRGDIDETAISSDVWVMESHRPELQKSIAFRRFYMLSYNYVAWNTGDPMLSDSRVRRALAMCVDLQSIINNIYHGTARAMNGPFTPDQWAYNPDVPVIQYDPEGAKRILASLGWLDTNGDGWLDKGGKPLRIEMAVVGGNSASNPFALLFQSELKKIGVDLAITPMDGPALLDRVLHGHYQTVYLSWDLNPDPDPYALYYSTQTPPRGQNFVFYKSAEADRLIDAGRRELDRSKRIPIYRQLHAVLANDQPYTWTVQVSSKWAISKRIHGVKESKGWGLFNWIPGELDWWIPRGQQTGDRTGK